MPRRSQETRDLIRQLKLSPYDQYDWTVRVDHDQSGKGSHVVAVQEGEDLIGIQLGAGHYPRTAIGLRVSRWFTQRLVDRVNRREHTLRAEARAHYRGTAGTEADLRRQVTAAILHL